MKVKASVTLSPELLEAIDGQPGAGLTRSQFTERAAWSAIRRTERDERDKGIYAEHAEEYNRQALESLDVQDAEW